MPVIVQPIPYRSPDALAAQFSSEPGCVLLRSGRLDPEQGRHSFLAVRPFLIFRSHGSRCEVETASGTEVQYGNPWFLLDQHIARYELLEEIDIPFPLGGCFGFWGYDLKQFVEPKLRATAVDDLELPNCWVGFYDHLLAFDHHLEKAWIISTGIRPDGSRDDALATKRVDWWQSRLMRPENSGSSEGESVRGQPVASNFSRDQFVAAVRRAQRYINAGHIYQVNLAQRLSASYAGQAFSFFQELSSRSPAPFAAYLNCGSFQLASSSPESFLRIAGSHIRTRPIKGTRPRSSDPIRDAQLTYELQTSAKEMAELVMITDLLRNDLGRICAYGSVSVPELVRLERYAHVQHLVSTVEGALRPDMTHFQAMAQCFPGGSITGAPKFRAMEIIDELEPVTRGPYTGCFGYVGFNRETQLSITIRTAILHEGQAHYYAGAGIVADSSPEAEYEETLAKAAGFMQALGHERAGRLTVNIANQKPGRA